MKPSFRTAAAVVLTTVASAALASSEAIEGQGEINGIMPLLYLVGGVAAMGVVIWLMLKVMNRAPKK
jgi:hypothetical protein